MDAVLAKIRASLGEIHYQGEGHLRRLAAAYATAHYPEDGSTEMELVHTLLARARAAKQQSASASV